MEQFRPGIPFKDQLNGIGLIQYIKQIITQSIIWFYLGYNTFFAFCLLHQSKTANIDTTIAGKAVNHTFVPSSIVAQAQNNERQAKEEPIAIVVIKIP